MIEGYIFYGDTVKTIKAINSITLQNHKLIIIKYEKTISLLIFHFCSMFS